MTTIFFFTWNVSCYFYQVLCKVQKFDLKNMLYNYFSIVLFSLITESN